MSIWTTRRWPTILIAEPDQVLRSDGTPCSVPHIGIVPTGSAEEAVRTALRHETKMDLLLTECVFGDWPAGNSRTFFDLIIPISRLFTCRVPSILKSGRTRIHLSLFCSKILSAPSFCVRLFARRWKPDRKIDSIPIPQCPNFLEKGLCHDRIQSIRDNHEEFLARLEHRCITSHDF
jgi:hypothetical protein